MNYIGENLRLSIFGASHEERIGMTLDGFPAGERIDPDALRAFLARRAPGQNAWSSARSEKDEPEILSGVQDGLSDGLPITAVIRNTDARSADYAALSTVPRPGHADYTAWVKTGSIPAGGGAWSGRMSAALCLAGGICLQALQRRGITLLSRIAGIGSVLDEGALTEDSRPGAFPTLSETRGRDMIAAIAAAREEGDSLGGVAECAVFGLPAGLGGALFEGLEGRIAALLYAIPAVKGVEFGSGFAAARLRGSENNDPFVLRRGRVETATNHCGGLLGGVTDGMPLVLRAAFKPTPSIAKKQRSVDLESMTETELTVPGRHDPCVVPRALPCVEAAAAIALCDALISFERRGDDLPALRARIDRIDGDLQTLFERRMELVDRIAAYKRDRGLPVRAAAREAEKLLSVDARAAADMAPYDAAFFKQLMALSRQRQEELRGEERA
ncbi:MAG: chorismate synthase [Oscillospiraceae bacterium]|nr:chorismate synthase [Oscillospiraceae bacterium]